MRSARQKFADKLEEARESCSDFIKCFEITQIILAVLLMIIGLGIAATGVGFIKADIWSSGGSHMDGVEKFILLLLILFVAATWIFSASAIVISKRPTCAIPCIALYGVLLFVVVVLPLMIQGVAFNKLGRIDPEEIDEYCDMSSRRMRRAGNRFVGSFFRFAHNFDRLSGQMLDKYMCTATCPCLDYGSNPSTKEVYMKDAEKLE